jgi:hypothetical protein
MIRALGYSQNPFNPADPGRLCRGRERWIEPYDQDAPPVLSRLVISGAQFSDDSARDALRGVPASGVPMAELLDSLFPGAAFLAFMEDGHPADIPELAEGVEVYLGHRAGGRVEEPMVRWTLGLQGLDSLRALFVADGDPAPVRGLLVNPTGPVTESLLETLFLLTGFSTLDSPPAQFQPAALPEALNTGSALVLFHRDKHGPALGVYTQEPLDVTAAISSTAQRFDALSVPFAIPPMLARWDRAIADLREAWMASREDDFPVPPAPEPTVWSGRSRRRGAPVEDEPELVVEE